MFKIKIPEMPLIALMVYCFVKLRSLDKEIKQKISLRAVKKLVWSCYSTKAIYIKLNMQKECCNGWHYNKLQKVLHIYTSRTITNLISISLIICIQKVRFWYVNLHKTSHPHSFSQSFASKFSTSLQLLEII